MILSGQDHMKNFQNLVPTLAFREFSLMKRSAASLHRSDARTQSVCTLPSPIFTLVGWMTG